MGRRPKTLERINRLIQEAAREPGSGTGEPEQLSGDLSGFWSRQIDQEHRLLYTVASDELVVVQGVSASCCRLDIMSNMCSDGSVRWEAQRIDVEEASALPGMPSIRGLLRSVQVPEFPGLTFYEVRSR
ncbi:MAG: Txe/YoeB family addiction module toxin, partial [Actinomycetota bacterium]|nr:Txe/YoeB family addiction module toxin [Actinomycetota bacterium]